MATTQAQEVEVKGIITILHQHVKNPVLQNPQDINFNPLENPCENGIVTQPSLPNIKTPCGKVKAQFANENYKNKVATINKNSYFKLKKETGFKENKDGTFEDLQASGGDALTIIL